MLQKHKLDRWTLSVFKILVMTGLELKTNIIHRFEM